VSHGRACNPDSGTHQVLQLLATARTVAATLTHVHLRLMCSRRACKTSPGNNCIRRLPRRARRTGSSRHRARSTTFPQAVVLFIITADDRQHLQGCRVKGVGGWERALDLLLHILRNLHTRENLLRVSGCSVRQQQHYVPTALCTSNGQATCADGPRGFGGSAVLKDPVNACVRDLHVCQIHRRWSSKQNPKDLVRATLDIRDPN
jgi:hypothetical protein